MKIAFFCTFAFLFSLLNSSPSHAQTSGNIRVEGHVFSATTLRPLPGAIVELWGFYKPESQLNSTDIVTSNEGGFYWTEHPFQLTDGDGKDMATGYAFAIICIYGDKENVQIMPLYSSLIPNQVYQRNVYLQVPAHVTACDKRG